ncbi:MAG: glycosyltransferase [Acidobacteria bacterium]|nr:glycosyltransferase [Acidobacteriota bacterium]
MRVIRIIDRLNVGGPAKHVTWLTAGLDPSEFETTLVTGTVPPGEGDMSWFASQSGVEPLVIPEMSRELSPRDALVILKLLRLFFELKPDIVHTHKAKAGAAGRLAAKLYKLISRRPVRIFHTFHGHIFHSYYGPFKTGVFLMIERVLARFCTDRIIVISNQQFEEIHGRFKIGQADQFSVIPLGLDLDHTATTGPGLRRELGIPDGVPLIGAVGRLCEVKNHSMFLRACARLKDAGARFVLIGDGHLRSELQALANDSGISDLVHFTGFRDDVLELYRDLNIVALTSLNEGTPLTLIEGMSRGVPAVATNVGGVRDLMGTILEERDGFQVCEHGLMVPSGDDRIFAEAIKYLLDRHDLRREMGERARKFVIKNYSKDRLIDDVSSLYKRIWSAAARRRFGI